MCPESTPDCENACLDSEADADAIGCLAQFQALVDCMLATDVCGDVEAQCPSEYAAFVACASGGGSGECAPTGTAPPSSDCTPLCERAQACPEAEPTDCAAACAENAADVEAMGCAMPYELYLGCASTCTNICSVSDEDCLLEFEQFYNCVIDYCTANPDSAPCI